MLSSIEAAIIDEWPIDLDLHDFRSKTRIFWSTFESHGSESDDDDEGANPLPDKLLGRTRITKKIRFRERCA
jgi:hypothetical protein